MFLAGVAEQFAIAEAKLRAWASMDDDEEEDSNDEEPLHAGKTHSFAQRSGADALMSIFHLIVVLAVFILTVVEQTPHLLPLSPPLSPPFMHSSAGVLTFCSSLRRRHVQSCHRSAIPV